MVNQTYLVALKLSQDVQHVVAATIEVHGEHLVFLNAERKLAALFPMKIVQSWSVLNHGTGSKVALKCEASRVPRASE